VGWRGTVVLRPFRLGKRRSAIYNGKPW